MTLWLIDPRQQLNTRQPRFALSLPQWAEGEGWKRKSERNLVGQDQGSLVSGAEALTHPCHQQTNAQLLPEQQLPRPCFGRRVGLDDPQRSLPTPTIL